MTTLLDKDTAGPLLNDRLNPPEQTKPKTSLLQRWIAWYRDAVARPASDEEKAEWQKTSF